MCYINYVRHLIMSIESTYHNSSGLENLMEIHGDGDHSQDDDLKDEDDEGDDEETVAINAPHVFAEVLLAKTVGEYHSI